MTIIDENSTTSKTATRPHDGGDQAPVAHIPMTPLTCDLVMAAYRALAEEPPRELAAFHEEHVALQEAAKASPAHPKPDWATEEYVAHNGVCSWSHEITRVEDAELITGRTVLVGVYHSSPDDEDRLSEDPHVAIEAGDSINVSAEDALLLADGIARAAKIALAAR